MRYKLKNIVNTPIKGVNKLTVTSKFNYGKHNGIDLIGGNTIITPYDGKVTSVKNSVKGYSITSKSGNYVTIDHGNGLTTVYYHLKQNSLKVKKGDIISKGTIIAKMGATGKVTGKHLHYGIKKNNKWVNPENYLIEEKTISTKDENSIIYIVKRGDNLTKIARMFGTTWKKIYADNKSIIGDNPNLIKVNQKLVIRID